MSKCYAQSLGGCSSTMSREHVFTKSVFGTGGLIGMEGFAQIPDSMISLNSAAAKVLCKSHNEQLSELDSEAKRLSDGISQFHVSDTDASIRIDGKKLERWLLKVAIGYGAAGFTSLGKLQPSDNLVRMLYGLSPIQSPLGLHSFVPVSRTQEHLKEVLFRALTANIETMGERVVGVFVALHGAPLLFSLSDIPMQAFLVRPDGSSYLDPYDTRTAATRYRPNEIMLTRYDPVRRLTILFDWT